MALFSPPGPPAGATCGRKSIVEPGTLLRADDKVEGIALENAASMASDIQTKGAAPSMADGRECYHKMEHRTDLDRNGEPRDLVGPDVKMPSMQSGGALARVATTGIYLLRGVPRDLQRTARRRAVREGTTLRRVLKEALREYAAETWTPRPGD